MRWSSEMEGILRGAGWYPGRNVETQVAGWESLLASGPDCMCMFPAARAALLEFGGLVLRPDGVAGREGGRVSVVLDPTLGAGMGECFRTFSTVVHGAVFPLGEVGDGHAILVVSQRGHTYLVMDAIREVAPTVDDGLERLVLGKRLTGQWTRPPA